MTKRILLSGEGGQGIQTIAKILSQSLFLSGKECSYMPNFGVEQRGTPSIAYVGINTSQSSSASPVFNIADYVLVLSRRAIKSICKYVTPNTTILFDSSTIARSDLPKNTQKVLGAPITQYASEKFTNKSVNLIALAVLCNLLDITERDVWQGVDVILGKKLKEKDIYNVSKEAFSFGYDIVLEKDSFSKPIYGTCHKSLVFKGHGKTGEVKPRQCKGCAICILKCPVSALKMSEELGVFSTPVPKIDTEKCIACQNCKNYCPDGAIAVEKDGK